jgi:hypothetical protein
MEGTLSRWSRLHLQSLAPTPVSRRVDVRQAAGRDNPKLAGDCQSASYSKISHEVQHDAPYNDIKSPLCFNNVRCVCL